MIQLVKLVTDQFAFGMSTPTYPGLGGQLPGTGTQPVIDRFAKTPTLATLGTSPPGPSGPGDQIQPRYNCCSHEQADMVDVQLRFEIDALYETKRGSGHSL